jgi:hypothetical protein
MKNRSFRKENIVQVYETQSANRLGYKTQSKYTKSKSRHRLVRFYRGTQVNALILRASQGKEGWSTGKLVLIQPQPFQFRQLAQFSRDGTWGIQNPVKTYKNQVTPS